MLKRQLFPLINCTSKLIAIIIVVVTMMACRGDYNPDKPQDAYYLFYEGLTNGDGHAVWNRLDDDTRDFFQHKYGQLQEMDGLIEQYLPLADHRLARRQSGAELTDSVTDGKELFLKLFKHNEAFQDEPYRVGAKIDEVRMSEDGESVLVVTRSGQEYLLIKGSDQQWYVAWSQSNQTLHKSFQWVDDNQLALSQTIEDLIAEEQRQREAIIAELMNFD